MTQSIASDFNFRLKTNLSCKVSRTPIYHNFMDHMLSQVGSAGGPCTFPPPIPPPLSSPTNTKCSTQ